MAKVLVIIPAFNEEKSISQVIAQIKLAGVGDILVVNDGSIDKTSELARQAGAKVVDLPFNLGIGGAMQTGYLYAANNNYEMAVQIDADGQHNPADLPKLMQAMIDGDYDMVVGSRFISKTAYKSSLARRLGILFFSGLIRLITGYKINDTTSGFRVVNKRVIALFANKYPIDYPEVEVLVLLRKMNFRIVEVEVHMANRQAGLSSITPLKGIYYMCKVSLALLMNSLRSKRGAYP